MLYVLYGTERLLMDQRLDKLKKDHHCNQEQMNYTVYDVSKEGMKVVLEDVMTPPFLSDEKMVVIKKADFLTTKKIKKDNHDIDYFMQCLPYLDKTVHLVIFNDEKEKEQIMNQLKEWGVNVIIDTDFAQRKEHERILEEKTKMREERKRLYEESKKRKR